MHVPEDKLGEYRRIRQRAREFKSLGNERSGRGDYAGASRAWAIEALVNAEANHLRVPGAGEGAPVSEPTIGQHRRTSYCAKCGETCKEYYAEVKGWGWNCLHCGYLTDEQVTQIANRADPLYSDGTAVRWVERRTL